MSIFSLIPATFRFSSPNRSGSACSAQRISAFQRPPMTSTAASNPQRYVRGCIQDPYVLVGTRLISRYLSSVKRFSSMESMGESKKQVGVLGLGRMGAALAGALLGAGHDVTVWNRSPVKAGPLLDRGARLAATPAEAASA